MLDTSDLSQPCSYENPFASLYYCTSNALIIPFILYLLLLLFTLGIIAQLYFAPNLSSISQTLSLSQTVAGVTLAALGNGAADLFSTYSAIKSNSPSLALGELFGAAGFIAVIAPFRVPRRPFIRDVLFFIATTIFAMLILWDGRITILESIGMILAYAIYVCVVVLGHIIYQGWERDRVLAQSILLETDDNYFANALIEEDYRPLLGGIPNTMIMPTLGAYTLPVRTPLMARRDLFLNDTLVRIPASSIASNQQSGETIDSHSINYRALLDQLFPVRVKWASIGYLRRLRYIILTPIVFCAEITIPVAPEYNDESITDQEASEDMHITRLEQRILLLIQGFVAPWVITLVLELSVLAPIICSILLPIFAWKYTKSPSKRQSLIHAFAGFLISMAWIYLIANQTVLLLQALGLIFAMDEAILGLTVFAVANSIGDFSTNVAITRMGFPAMAIGACFGSPMLNILLGVGVSCSIVMAKQGLSVYTLRVSETVFVSGIGIICGLVFSLLAISFNGFKAGRVYGAVLMAGYFCCIGASLQYW